jgi:CubicO group peptidase (beta-lactamase class C family)
MPQHPELLSRLVVSAAILTCLLGSARPAQAADCPDLASAAPAAAELPQLKSLLVSWRGRVILEHHARGVRSNAPANVKSVSKSVISALVGIAIERRLIKSVSEPISTYFPELRRDPDARKRAITIDDLLTMRSGLESTSGPQYGPWVRSRNWVRHILTRPLVSEPGTTMEYSTGTSHLLSAILTKVSKTSTWQFAQRVLARPLGFQLARWTRDPQGIYLGGNEMLMTPAQMRALGELYLNEGRVDGRQVVPAAWVATSCEPRTVSRWDPGREYGYGWWIDEIGGQQACFAWGFGGQYIMVFRDLQLVVVATSSTAVNDERWDYRDKLLSVVARDIVGPVSAADSGCGGQTGDGASKGRGLSGHGAE